MLLSRPKRSRSTFYCFSPPVMIATFAVEIFMAVYVLWRYTLTPLSRLVVATLSFLALFQVSEYFVCGGVGLSAMHWSRIGYAAITVLPPLGVHIMYVLAGKKIDKVVWLAYATGAGFIGYFLTYHQVFTGYECAGNYVIFQLTGLATAAYATYYYVWLLTAMVLGYKWHEQAKNRKVRRSIYALIMGYLVFLIPTGVAAALHPEALSGIPSIMCGFAVLFALILTWFLMPLRGKRRK